MLFRVCAKELVACYIVFSVWFLVIVFFSFYFHRELLACSSMAVFIKETRSMRGDDIHCVGNTGLIGFVCAIHTHIELLPRYIWQAQIDIA